MLLPGGSKLYDSKKKVEALEKKSRTEAGANWMVWVRCDSLDEGSLKIDSSAKKHFTAEQLLAWARKADAKDGASHRPPACSPIATCI